MNEGNGIHLENAHLLSEVLADGKDVFREVGRRTLSGSYAQTYIFNYRDLKHTNVSPNGFIRV